MKDYLKHHEWKIIEDAFHPQYQRISESIFSIGNGKFGGRGNFEETYSGDSLPGNYIGGVYYPDKTRVGWWKVGYPEYFAKVPNACNWIGIKLQAGSETLDLHTIKHRDFSRELDMKAGLLKRSFVAIFTNGLELQCQFTRFCSMAQPELGVVRCSFTPLNQDAELNLEAFLDADVRNEDANYDEFFWEPVQTSCNESLGIIQTRTRKTEFDVCHAMISKLAIDTDRITAIPKPEKKELRVSHSYTVNIPKGKTCTLDKFVAIESSLNIDKDKLINTCTEIVVDSRKKGVEQLKEDQAKAWAGYWENCDVTLAGDIEGQQAIRFNIFQLFQTYTGRNPKLNIGPKGFTGEKYGGSTYWDTEAFCLPFYLSASSQSVARNLLLYRYNQLPQAIENAEKLGFRRGAALYPMVTMNGEECHNEWEITFEEIHRNGAIAYAIFDYTRYTGDENYILNYGAEVLIAIARFWAQRVNWSEPKQQYVMLGVTGPNEYENNVNNNWYTNYIATWCLQYTYDILQWIRYDHPATYERLQEKTHFDDEVELNQWTEIVENMYYPFDLDRNIFLQQEGFLDKVIEPVSKLDKTDLPLNQNWSWDRILRSCYIKQADVLQGLYFFEDDFSLDILRSNFDFYEPITVHESSLSPSVHAVLACRLDNYDKAYEMYLRTARLDLHDINNDTDEGLHITSMTGSWMAIVKGFCGMRVIDNTLTFQPYLPRRWKSISFHIRFRKALVKISLTPDTLTITHLSGPEILTGLPTDARKLQPGTSVEWALPKLVK